VFGGKGREVKLVFREVETKQELAPLSRLSGCELNSVLWLGMPGLMDDNFDKAKEGFLYGIVRTLLSTSKATQ
jgi:hypothetical protein